MTPEPPEGGGESGVGTPPAGLGTTEVDAGRGERHTRLSGAWAAIVVAVLLGIALIDFIVQNTRSVRIEFFSASGHVPLAVALLAAAVASAIVVLGIGLARMAQLRLAVRRHRRHAQARTGPLAPQDQQEGRRSEGGSDEPRRR